VCKTKLNRLRFILRKKKTTQIKEMYNLKSFKNQELMNVLIVSVVQVLQS